MQPIRIVAVALIVAGVLALAYGGFSYTRETHEARIGPLALQVQEKEYVNIPLWMGVVAIAVGGVLLVVGGKR